VGWARGLGGIVRFYAMWFAVLLVLGLVQVFALLCGNACPAPLVLGRARMLVQLLLGLLLVVGFLGGVAWLRTTSLQLISRCLLISSARRRGIRTVIVTDIQAPNVYTALPLNDTPSHRILHKALTI
jgi:hypothetical protein